MSKESYPCETKSHPYIKEKEKIKVMQGAAALADKGIKLGTSTSVDKNGVGGTWKNT
jgi:hypothetical protein